MEGDNAHQFNRSQKPDVMGISQGYFDPPALSTAPSEKLLGFRVAHQGQQQFSN